MLGCSKFVCRDLGTSVCILCGPQGPYMCNLLYVYAFGTNACIVHGMVCCYIVMKRMWYGESSILNLLPLFYYAC